ncbi:MAG TPA: Rieske (2Fe-2S) protein [Polyangiaceae bacterium]|jgi:nitrite reductase (NADH) small subunit
MEVTLGPITAIPKGEGRSFQVGPAQIAVFRARDGAVFATQAECPHRRGPLADGLLGSGTLICPLHSLKFDLSTGRAENGDCALKTYPARLSEAGQILVDLRDAP